MIKITFLLIALIIEILVFPSPGFLKYLDIFSITAIFFSLTGKEPWIILASLVGALALESLTFYPLGFLALAVFLTIWFGRASLGSIFTHRSWPSLALLSFLVALFYNVIILIGDLLFGLRPLLINNLIIKLLLGIIFNAIFLFLLVVIGARNMRHLGASAIGYNKG